MTLDDIWAQLEFDLSRRQDEVRLLANSTRNLSRVGDQDRARRAQVVMLYAHLEGFSKVALSTYLKAINDLNLKSQDTVEAISACAFGDVFHAITYGDQKGKVFKKSLPADQGLSIFSRRCEFMAEIQNLLSRPINIPDDAVDTESNLTSKVLRRNLFRIGFPPNKFALYDNDLDELVYRRHNIAHGVDLTPVRKDLYERLQRMAFNFMDELTLAIVTAVEKSEYLR